MNDTAQPEKLPLTSLDIAAEKRDELRRALASTFPEIVAEDKIDFDQLKRVLGEWADPDRERFGLSWPGKAACMKVIQAPSVGTLKPCPEESVDWDTTQNVFIEGDNLEVLKLLQKAYFAKVKMIYIDPPYNTGKEFIYPDKYSETLDTYLEYTGQKDSEGRKFSTNTDSSGRFHSRWLNMMYPRLFLAKNLLREDGAIFISIDDNEVTNLEQLCDQIFGSENHVGTIPVINNMKGRNDKINIATCHEYLVIYARPGFRSFGIPLTEEQLANYKFEDEKSQKYALRDLRKRGNQDKREDRPNMFFPIFFDQLTGKCTLERRNPADIEILPKLGDGRDGRWRWGLDKVTRNLAFLHPKYNKSKDKWGIEHRVYLDPSIQIEDGDEEADDDDVLFDRTSKPKSFWWGAEVSTDIASREFKDLFEEINGDHPKSPFLVEKMIHMATRPGDIVLDFFAGYSTTAHAAYIVNAKESRDRNFIMVQLPEPCEPTSDEAKAGFKNIAQISRERIRRASAKVRSQLAAMQEPTSHDLGFRAFFLASSCFGVWNPVADGLSDADLVKRLTAHEGHLDSKARGDDILFELLLKDAYKLTDSVEKKSVAGKDVFSVRGGDLLICLDRQITQEVIDAMADMEPSRVICLDAGFQGNDQLKANAVQTFKARARNRETAIEFRTV